MDNAVDIETGYGLYDRAVGVQIPVDATLFSSPLRQDRFWAPTNLLSNGYRGSFSGSKADGVRG
jgi:hypothetical protein